MQMHLEVDLCSGVNQPSGAFRKNIASLTDRIFIQEYTLLADFKCSIRVVQFSAVESFGRGLHQRSPDVMDDRKTLSGMIWTPLMYRSSFRPGSIVMSGH